MAVTRQRIGRAGFLRRGGTLLVAASGLGAFAPAALADTTPPAGDLAYLRLLIAGELLAVDFQGRGLASGKLRRPASALARDIRSDEHEHYTLLAALLVAAGQTPAGAGDIDFSYPASTFRSQKSIVEFGLKLERVLSGGYVDALENVQTPALRVTMARILANEAQHHGALAALEGEPVIERRFPSPVRTETLSNFLDTYES